MKNELNKISLTFPSKSTNEGFARSAMAAFAAQLDPTIDEINDIKTAVSEGVTNCIVHAYPDCVGKITLTGTIYEGGVLELKIKDCGRGIADISQARTPMFTTGGAERSGMGFTIMESFMDDFKIVSKEGKGTTISMSKRIKPRIGVVVKR